MISQIPTSVRIFARRHRRQAALWLLGLACSSALAQTAATDPIALAKWDANRNGRLDPSELDAMAAAERKVLVEPATPRAGDPALQMSPFEVVSDNTGYFAANTMSGTRLNSKLEDLGAAISVVTKEQMTDFALLDMNDIFNYEASTEGTGNFTEFAFNRNFEAEAATQLAPDTANRIRGLGNANTTLGNFETSGRVPIDPLMVDAVEISRGPNASIFGIGSAAGTVNSVPSAANLTRNRSQLSLRGDSFGGYRSSIDLNRVLKRNVLAVRGSASYQHDGFDLKPSGLDSVRLNGMARWKPFKSTTLTASYSTYRMAGNRPNVTPPRETVTSWIAAGRPTWDPVARTLKRDGVVVSTHPLNTATPTIFTPSPQLNFVNYYVDGGGITYASPPIETLRTTPGTFKASYPNGIHLLNISNDPTGFRTAQPLYAKIPSATDKSLYDWSSLNFAAANRVEDSSEIANVMVDQIIFETRRHLLAAQAGWFREQSERYSRNSIGVTSNVGSVAALHIDINERRVDGTPNPYFLRPFYGATVPPHTVEPMERDTYRAQLAYRLDLRGEKNGLRWLGMHQVTGYDEYKKVASRRIQYYHAIADKHAWLGEGVAHAGRGSRIGGLPVAGPNIALGYFRYYLGDNQGVNVDYAPADFSAGPTTLTYGNAADGFVRENIQVAPAVFAAGGGNNQLSILKSRGAIIQSHLLKDRIVTTFGIRRDQRFGRSGSSLRLLPDGVNIDYSTFNNWAGGDWSMGKGPTRTAGIVVKPLSWLSLHANRSDSFQPAAVNQDIYLRTITDPTGVGEDYGVSLNLFRGKLYIRANQYKTSSLDARSSAGTSATIGMRLRGIDFANAGYQGSVGDLQTAATRWVDADATAKGLNLTPEQRLQKTADIMQLPVEYLKQQLTYPFNAVEDYIAQGTEIEIHYNPTNYWTLKGNVVKQESIVKNLAPELNQWMGERMKVWQSIINPLTGQPWYTEKVATASQSARDFLASSSGVIPPLALAQALEGKSRPQIRKYRANFSTSFRLAGITDHKVLRKLTVGGAARWEDKAAIGFHGVEQAPAIVTTFDANRPIWDKANLNLDAFVSYRTRFLSDKIMATWQLNVRNLAENGRLQPIAADPDGQFSAYRIISPRQFILTVTFDL
jgi:outer membrane receptor protein involved in Fe transport